jgi:hypothetical protein
MDGSSEQEVALNHEREIKTISGWPMLAAVIVIFVISIGLFIAAGVWGDRGSSSTGAIWVLIIVGALPLILGCFLSPGFFTLEPDETRVGVLRGHYKGAVRQVVETGTVYT